jgi:hypothetical protein
MVIEKSLIAFVTHVGAHDAVTFGAERFGKLPGELRQVIVYDVDDSGKAASRKLGVVISRNATSPQFYYLHRQCRTSMWSLWNTQGDIRKWSNS